MWLMKLEGVAEEKVWLMKVASTQAPPPTQLPIAQQGWYLVFFVEVTFSSI